MTQTEAAASIGKLVKIKPDNGHPNWCGGKLVQVDNKHAYVLPVNHTRQPPVKVKFHCVRLWKAANL